MARTRRSPLVYQRETENRHTRERRHRLWDTLPIGAYPDEYVAWYGTFRGGMLMCPSQCGIWDDCRPMSGKGEDRRKQRRNVKRSERQRVMREAWDYATEYLSDPINY